MGTLDTGESVAGAVASMAALFCEISEQPRNQRKNERTESNQTDTHKTRFAIKVQNDHPQSQSLLAHLSIVLQLARIAASRQRRINATGVSTFLLNEQEVGAYGV